MRNESLPELAQAIKQLIRRAYPGTSPVVRDTLALYYFIDAIPETEIGLRLREVGPKTINEAEHIAVRLEALRVADRQKGKSVRANGATNEDNSGEINDLKESIKVLRGEVSALKNTKVENQNKNFNRRSWNNNKPNNTQRQGQFRRTENWQESKTRVGFRPNQTGPTQ